MQTIVNGISTHIVDSGSGSAVVLLHGWGSSSQDFSGIQQSLAKSYRTIAIDLPGFGGSEMPDQPWGVEDYAQFVQAALKKRGVSNPHAYIGHSMGGRILLHMLGDGGQSAKKAILIGSHGLRESASMRNRIFKVIAKVGKLVTRILPSQARTRLRAKLYQSAGASDYVNAGEMQETFKKIISTDTQASAAKISIPVLLIYGDSDKQTPVTFGELFSRSISNSKLEVIQDAGHYPHHDQPEHVLQLIEEFLT